MKKIIKKKSKKLKYFLLKNPIKIVNNHFPDLSVSISGEFEFTNTTILFRRYYTSDLEMF